MDSHTNPANKVQTLIDDVGKLAQHAVNLDVCVSNADIGNGDSLTGKQYCDLIRMALIKTYVDKLNTVMDDIIMPTATNITLRKQRRDKSVNELSLQRLLDEETHGNG